LIGSPAQVWEASSASIGIALDTVLGPIRWDFGYADGGRTEFYFSAGYDF
jgi:hypothetical protein